MKRIVLHRLIGVVLLVVLPALAMCEESAVLHRVLFHSGRVVVGEIVLRNEDVEFAQLINLAKVPFFSEIVCYIFFFLNTHTTLF